MEDDLMNDIENAHAQKDLGRTAARIFAGARAEGAKRMDSYLIVMAWWAAIFQEAWLSTIAPEEDDEDDDDE